jgi:rhodanese-related sulfurtransferase
MAKKHSPGFERICEEARKNIKEVSIQDVKKELEKKSDFVLIDVREDHEWNEGHLPQAMHLGKGIIERDIEERIPNVNTNLILYCGGGYRSALAAESIKRIGYKNVQSMAGGFRSWKEAHLPISQDGKK